MHLCIPGACPASGGLSFLNRITLSEQKFTFFFGSLHSWKVTKMHFNQITSKCATLYNTAPRWMLTSLSLSISIFRRNQNVFSTCYFANILPLHNQRSIFIAFQTWLFIDMPTITKSGLLPHNSIQACISGTVRMIWLNNCTNILLWQIKIKLESVRRFQI